MEEQRVPGSLLAPADSESVNTTGAKSGQRSSLRPVPAIFTEITWPEHGGLPRDNSAVHSLRYETTLLRGLQKHYVCDPTVSWCIVRFCSCKIKLTNSHPYAKSYPGFNTQHHHKVDINHDTDTWKHRDEWNLKEGIKHESILLWNRNFLSKNWEWECKWGF
jgi:hypothetical protein